MTNITLNYTMKAVNETTNQVATIGKTVYAHGNFIVEQGKYNVEAEMDKANCTLIIKDLKKLEITLGEGQRGKQIEMAVKKTEKLLKDSGVDTKTIYSINSFSSRQNTIRVRFRTMHY